MEAMDYEFKMPIGDWSGDGHGKCNYYRILSNKPVEQVREAHYKSKEATGIDINEICSEYHEDIMSKETADKLVALGFSPKEHDWMETCAQEDGIWVGPSGMAAIWCFLLMRTDPTLELEMRSEDSVPMLAFYGRDAKKRHIDFVGYGCFDD